MRLRRPIPSKLYSDTIEDTDCSLDAPMQSLAFVYELSQRTGKLPVLRLSDAVVRIGEEPPSTHSCSGPV